MKRFYVMLAAGMLIPVIADRWMIAYPFKDLNIAAYIFYDLLGAQVAQFLVEDVKYITNDKEVA